MARTLIFHHLPDLNDLPAAERWNHRYHVPEVMRGRPIGYVSYQAVPPPPGAEAFGLFNYKMHESISRDDGELPLGRTALTKEVVPLDVVMVNTALAPTDDLLGADLTLDAGTVLRWVTVFRYPDGVGVEEGDDWYLRTHIPEVRRQPGLTRCFSHTIAPFLMQAGQQIRLPFLHPDTTFSSNWHRVTELWYEDGRGWARSVLEEPPDYTPPPWATAGRYPFLEPGRDFRSIFLLERPTHDWLREIAPAPI